MKDIYTVLQTFFFLFKEKGRTSGLLHYRWKIGLKLENEMRART